MLFLYLNFIRTHRPPYLSPPSPFSLISPLFFFASKRLSSHSILSIGYTFLQRETFLFRLLHCFLILRVCYMPCCRELSKYAHTIFLLPAACSRLFAHPIDRRACSSAFLDNYALSLSLYFMSNRQINARNTHTLTRLHIIVTITGQLYRLILTKFGFCESATLPLK